MIEVVELAVLGEVSWHEIEIQELYPKKQNYLSKFGSDWFFG